MRISIFLVFQAAILSALLLCCYVSISQPVYGLAPYYNYYLYSALLNAGETSILQNSSFLNMHNITATIGREFQIALESNPNTGYQWTAVFDKNILKLNSHIFEGSSERAIGSSGKEIFTFTALHSGTTTLNFSYKRSWEPKPIEEKIYSITIP